MQQKGSVRPAKEPTSSTTFRQANPRQDLFPQNIMQMLGIHGLSGTVDHSQFEKLSFAASTPSLAFMRKPVSH